MTTLRLPASGSVANLRSVKGPGALGPELTPPQRGQPFQALSQRYSHRVAVAATTSHILTTYEFSQTNPTLSHLLCFQLLDAHRVQVQDKRCEARGSRENVFIMTI